MPTRNPRRRRRSARQQLQLQRRRARDSGNVATVWRTHSESPVPALVVTTADRDHQPVATVEYDREVGPGVAFTLARALAADHDLIKLAAKTEFASITVRDLRGPALKRLPAWLVNLTLFPVDARCRTIRRGTFRALAYSVERGLGAIARLMTDAGLPRRSVGGSAATTERLAAVA